MPQLTLTLTLTDELLQAAQDYARQHGQPLETLVAELLQTTTRPAIEEPDRPLPGELSPRIQRLYGSLKAPVDFDYKKELEDGLTEKYEL